MAPRPHDRPPRSLGRRLLAVLLAVAALGVVRPPVHAEARPAPLPVLSRLLGGEAASFLQEINLLRTTLGMPALVVSDQLTQVATSWAQQMAAEGHISHNPDLSTLVSGWSHLAENVGSGWDVLGLMQAFVDSPGHYANLVNPAYTRVGVGVAHGADGALFTVHDFMRERGATAPAPDLGPAPPDPAPAPAPRSRPSTPTPSTAPTTIAVTAPETPEPIPVPGPHPTPARVAAVLEPLRSLEATVRAVS